MKHEMTISVRVHGQYAKYDDFDPFKENVELFHEECAGGRVTVVRGGSYTFKCKTCGTESGLYPPSAFNCALRTIMVSRTNQRICDSDGSVDLIPLPVPPAPPLCGKCKRPVDLKTNEHAVFQVADGPLVHIHTACITAKPKEETVSSDEGRLNDLLQELQAMARQQAEPSPTKGTK